MVENDLSLLFEQAELKCLFLSENFTGKNDVDILVLKMTNSSLKTLIKLVEISTQWHLVVLKKTLSEGFNMTLFDFQKNSLVRVDLYSQLTLSTFVTYPWIYFIPTRFDNGDYLVDTSVRLKPAQLVSLYRCFRGLIKEKQNVNFAILDEIAQINSEAANEWMTSIEALKNKDRSAAVIRRLLHEKGWHKKINPLKQIITKLMNMLNYSPAPHIAIIGPDGCGKSTVIESLIKDFDYSYGSSMYLHLRPTVVPASRSVKSRLTQQNIIIPNPHKYAPYSFLKGGLKFFILYLDYSVGYIRLIYKRLHGVPVISDRYFYDLLVDPKRFRLKRLVGFKRLLMKILPRPQKTIFLKVSPEEVFRRKKDLTLPEIERQMAEFAILQDSYKEIITVNANATPEKVYAEVKNVIFGG